MIPASAAFWLDVLRAGAAAAVLLSHWRNLFFIDAKDAGALTFVGKSFYFVTGFGHEAVILFFVLSGLLVSPAIWRDVPRGLFSWREYLIQRLARLLIVLLPALIAGWLLDHAGMALFGDANIYGGDRLGGNIITWEVGSHSSLRTYLGNALFLQSIYVPSAGTNGPLWSLSYELWYYVLFPCIVIALFGVKDAWPRRLAFAAIAVGLAGWFLPSYIVFYGLFWLLGALAALARLKGLVGKPSRALTGAAVVLFLAALSYVRSRQAFQLTHLSDFECDALIAVATTVLVYRLLSATAESRVPAPLVGIAHGAAGFSYSLYLAHLPLLVFLRAAVVRGERWPAEGTALLLPLGVLVLTVTYCYGFSRLTEAHTDRLRRLLRGQRLRVPAV